MSGWAKYVKHKVNGQYLIFGPKGFPRGASLSMPANKPVKFQFDDLPGAYKFRIASQVDLSHPLAKHLKSNNKTLRMLGHKIPKLPDYPFTHHCFAEWDVYLDNDLTTAVLGKAKVKIVKSKLLKSSGFSISPDIPFVDIVGDDFELSVDDDHQNVLVSTSHSPKAINLTVRAFQGKSELLSTKYSLILAPPKKKPKPKPKPPEKPKFKTQTFVFGPFETNLPKNKSGYGKLDKKAKVSGAWTISDLKRFYAGVSQECKDYYTYSKTEKRPAAPRNLIKGFADTRGAEASNHGLSKTRALAVQQLMLDTFGGDPAWFPIKAVGERVANKDGEKGKDVAKNRVVEVTVQYF